MASGQQPAAAPTPTRRRQRILTAPLAVFLLVVLAIVGTALVRSSLLPGPADAIELLGDGDLDGDERIRVLRSLANTGRDSAVVAERWGAMLAAIALEDRPAFEASFAALGGAGANRQVPPTADRELLHLGDPLLGNIAAAMLAEAAGDRVEAVKRWGQAQVQCHLMRRPLANELAEEALRRLR